MKVHPAKAIAFLGLILSLSRSIHAQSMMAAGTEDVLSLAVFISGINDTGSITGSSDSGRPFVEAVNLAVELINNDTGLIPGYVLEYELADSQCSPGTSVRRFIDQVFTEPLKIMIIGADCSTATEPIAELAPFWNLVQISPVSSSSDLSRNSTYPTFLRVASSDAATAEGVVVLMQAFNWTRVAALSQQETIFTSTLTQLRENLNNASIEVTPREFTFNTNDNPADAVFRLGNSSTRIILLNMYPSVAMEVLCLAYNLEMTRQNGYLWLLNAWYPEDWWLADPEERSTYECSQEVMEEMLEYAILIDHYSEVAEEDRQTPTNASLSREEFDAIIAKRLEGAKDTSLALQAQFYFDAVWSAALALHSLVVYGNYDLSRFNHDPNDNVSVEISRAIFNSTQSLRFTGMSGPVQFDAVGDRYPSLRYFQYIRDMGMLERRMISLDDTSAIFPFGVPQDEEFVHISLGLLVVYIILASVGVVFAFVCLIINIVFREKKVIKLSSPYLNVLIVSGIILFYVDIILFGIDESTATTSIVDALCMLRLWIASIAFSLVFGTIFVKTWRVYYVFYSSNRHKRSKKTLIQDWVLFLMVAVLVGMDIVFMVFVTSFDSARLHLENTEIASNSRDLPQVIGLCRSEHRTIWISVLFVYKGILLVVGVFLAFETRNVKIHHLNDSKLIGMSVYMIMVLCISLGAVGLLLETHVDTFYAVVGLMVMIGNTSLLCLIFVPKFYSLWKDPEGLNVMGNSDQATTTTIGSDNKETISQLNQEIQKLRQELAYVHKRQSFMSLQSTTIPEESLQLVSRAAAATTTTNNINNGSNSNSYHSDDMSPQIKRRSERSVSFSEIVTNHHNILATDDMEVTEVSISFKDQEEEKTSE